MKIIDISNPLRVERFPDESFVLLSNGNYNMHGLKIIHVELRLYIDRIDENLGSFSLITSFVKTENDSIEMLYEEGYFGSEHFKKLKDFLISNLGISGLILRSIISLESFQKSK